MQKKTRTKKKRSRWVCLKRRPQNVFKTWHSIHSGIVSEFVAFHLLLFSYSTSPPLPLRLLSSPCPSGITVCASVFLSFSLFCSPFLSFFNFISFWPIDTIEYFSSKVSDKSQDILWNNNRSASIVRLNNRWKVSMKCVEEKDLKKPTNTHIHQPNQIHSFPMYPRLAFVREEEAERKKKKSEWTSERI